MKLRLFLPGLLVILLSFPAYAEEVGIGDYASVSDEALKEANTDDIYEELEKFANTLTIIEDHYVDDVKSKELIHGALKGMLQSLDPYSQFLDKEAHTDIKVETEGKFGGVGVEVSIREGVLTVISPVDDSPAHKAGLQPQDKIVKIDDQSTRDMNLSECVDLLRGTPGSTVVLSIIREGESKVIEASIKRAIIHIESIKHPVVLPGDIGYIRISDFQEQTTKDFRKALAKLEEDNIVGLILDLRNNPGGLLPQAILIAEEFTPKGLKIVSIKGRVEEQNTEFMSKGLEEKKNYPIIVLINKGSASASEIVAGALQDHKLAIVVGTQSFGKGSVQTVIPMRDSTALRLTTSKYYTPEDRMIHGVGITPDVEIGFKKFETEELDNSESEKNVSDIFKKVEKAIHKSKDEEAIERLSQRDNQVISAMDLIKAMNVYTKE